jgi:DNA-binding NarL/FixJ family response regulator
MSNAKTTRTPHPIPIDLVRRIAELYDAGTPTKIIAAETGRTTGTVGNVIHRLVKQGVVQSRHKLLREAWNNLAPLRPSASGPSP